MRASTTLVRLAFACALAVSIGCGSSKESPTGGTGGTVGGAGGGGAGTGGGTGGVPGVAGSGGGGAVAPDAGADASASCDGGCGTGRACCGGRCVNTANDPFNCGQCGVICGGATPFCAGSCQAPPCEATTCGAGRCCGTQCCAPGQLCCQEQGPVSRLPVCHTPTAAEPTCPQGCAPLCRSDRDQKRDITPADPQAVLARLRGLPVATWRYREEPAGVRHLGPMAQDFRAAFGLGADDRSYHAVDAQGVALAAIQALERMAAEQRRRIEALEAENRRLARRIRQLETRE